MGEYRNPDASFWRGKRVLVTGHSGFKGGWLSLWLNELGATVAGVSIAPATQSNLYSLAKVDLVTESRFIDIRDRTALAAFIQAENPEIVFHLAAQPLVRASYREPLETFAVNVQGTANVLDAVRTCTAARVVVAVTTDKVYRNGESFLPYREADALGGHDPYSASKAAAELVIGCYRDSYLSAGAIAVASARAGNVIGGGDWSEDRLIPDAVRAWEAGSILQIRRPSAVRPWQHVLEPIFGYLRLAEHLWQDASAAGAYNFGPLTYEAATVREIVLLARNAFGGGDIAWGDEDEGPHEAGWLALEIAKSRHMLGVEPRWGANEAVSRTMKWYRALRDGADARQLCLDDITAFKAAGR